MFHRSRIKIRRLSYSLTLLQLLSLHLNSLISVASAKALPTRVHFDPIDDLFKLNILPPSVTVSPHTTSPPHPFVPLPYINSIHRYTTAQTKTLADEVDLWHRILGHCDAATMRSLAVPGKVMSFPSHLTPSVIRKHFPIACIDCPQGNLRTTL